MYQVSYLYHKEGIVLLGGVAKIVQIKQCLWLGQVIVVQTKIQSTSRCSEVWNAR